MTLIRRHRVGAHTLERAVEEATGIKGLHPNRQPNPVLLSLRLQPSWTRRGPVHCPAALPHARVPGGSCDARGL